MEENEQKEPLEKRPEQDCGGNKTTNPEADVQMRSEITMQEADIQTSPEIVKSETVRLRETLRLRKTDYVRQQVEKQRAAEDLLTEQIAEEQRILDEVLYTIDDNMNRTEESRKYNKEMQEEINARIYGMHGITGDKMQGMEESRNAYYRGCAFSLFLLSVILTLLCGFLHGFAAEITLFMLSYTGIEGALLSKEDRRGRWLSLLCRVLYLFMFPAMMVIFVCYELGYPEYGQFLPWMVAGGVVIVILAVSSVFLYDPYRKDKKRVRNAKNYISDIEKLAKKEVHKNRKIRDREEKKEQKAAERREQKEQRKKQRKQRLEQRKQNWEERRKKKQQPED